MNKPILIVGSGLVGSLLATRLAKAGQSVEVFEKRPDPRTVAYEGRSINLALSHRGIQALREAGVFEHLEPDLIPMHGRMMHDLEGGQIFQAYGKEGQFINSVSRGGLNNALINAAENQGTQFHFEYQLKTILKFCFFSKHRATYDCYSCAFCWHRTLIFDNKRCF